MADVSFTPTFRHTDYVDNRDRVQAGGPNGFNARFSAIQADLTTLSTVVGQVDAELDALGAPTPTQRTLTLTPSFLPVVNAGAWSHDASGFANRVGNLTTLSGLMPVPLPHGAVLGSLRALGQNSGTGSLRITLFRSRLLAAVAPVERIVRVNGDANPFDQRESVPSSLAQVDTTAFRYFLLATLDGATASDVVSLFGFQVVFTA
jgi:hypothetical protein